MSYFQLIYLRACFSSISALELKKNVNRKIIDPGGGEEGHFNFICTGVCGHRIGKLTHPQTNAGPKTDPF